VALDLYVPHRGKVDSTPPTARDLRLVERHADNTATHGQRHRVIDSRVARIDAGEMRKACDEDCELGYPGYAQARERGRRRLINGAPSAPGHVRPSGDQE
jgi:hypothetical protein